ncbi:MAG: glycosyltransferase family 2 protein, partial [Bacteroidota bacterium]|nr:glycosyltransferase family 2 protein [Bacteroidota bacterium]
LWHDDEWVEKNIPDVNEFDFSKIDSIAKFVETHPEVMSGRIAKYNWNFTPPVKIKRSWMDALLDFMEKTAKICVGEYRNFIRVK